MKLSIICIKVAKINSSGTFFSAERLCLLITGVVQKMFSVGVRCLPLTLQQIVALTHDFRMVLRGLSVKSNRTDICFPSFGYVLKKR